MKIYEIAIIISFILLAASAYAPPITSQGYLKPPILLDPASAHVLVQPKDALPYEDVQHYAYYNYAIHYFLPLHLKFEVDVDPRIISKPQINYRLNIPPGYDFTSSPTSNIDILDNLGYHQAYKFYYDLWVWQGETTIGIGYKASGGIDDLGAALYSGAGNPIGPDRIEVTAYNSFIVTGTSGLSVNQTVK